MSRSKRRKPFFSATMADSERSDKRLAHKRLRQKMRQAALDDDPPDTRLRSVNNVAFWAKDGKTYWPEGATPKRMAK